MRSPQSPTSRTTTACVGCHRRKIKCDGRSPKCTACARRGSICEPHFRTRRAGVSIEEERRLRDRLAWLEGELGEACGLTRDEVRNTPTGTRVVPVDATATAAGPARQADNDNHGRPREDKIVDGVNKEVEDIAADVAVLSLNATGELRFMGGASGVLFSKLIASIVKGSAHGSGAEPFVAPHLPVGSARREGEAPVSVGLDAPPLGIAQHLLQMYLRWTHMKCPIFHQSALRMLFDSIYQENSHPSPAEQTIFYLVMLIGACHRRFSQGEQETTAYSTANLFNRAMYWFGKVLPVDGIEGLQIVLLLAIYTSYQPTGSSQWHLLGIAMRLCIDLGLHRRNTNWKFDDRQFDLRRRLFWATYALDRTVCFNLGRPLTLSDEQIDALLPSQNMSQSDEEPPITLAIHHIHLRQIQSRIISEVYTPGRLKVFTSDAKRLQILSSLQEDLDQWREQLNVVYSPRLTSHSFQWYERLYHTTTAALHRATPLFPRPSEDSICRCYDASKRAIQIYYSLLRSNEMERSWMLIQGTFLAGITMLYTIWASDTFSQIVRIDEVSELCRMCSNTLAVLGSGNAPSKFCDALETLTNLTTKKLVAQLQQRANANANNGPLYTNDMYPSDLLSIDPTLYFSNMSWPEEFNFHNALMNPDSITEVFGELINWHG